MAIVWLTRPDNEDEGLAFGTEYVFLYIWQKNKNGDSMSQLPELNTIPDQSDSSWKSSATAFWGE